MRRGYALEEIARLPVWAAGAALPRAAGASARVPGPGAPWMAALATGPPRHKSAPAVPGRKTAELAPRAAGHSSAAPGTPPFRRRSRRANPPTDPKRGRLRL